ncbi:MAG: hypothetical protein ACKO65_04685, partial [Betaproteobacteria bacterium]
MSDKQSPSDNIPSEAAPSEAKSSEAQSPERESLEGDATTPASGAAGDATAIDLASNDVAAIDVASNDVTAHAGAPNGHEESVKPSPAPSQQPPAASSAETVSEPGQTSARERPWWWPSWPENAEARLKLMLA